MTAPPARLALDGSALHHAILRDFVDRGHPPSIEELARRWARPRAEVVAALRALADDHGVVLQPATSEVWVAHPFSAAPTNFWVTSGRGRWWGNCAWCSLGVAALVGGDVAIATTLGGEHEPATVRIAGGELVDGDYLVHFPVPMARAWDNVVYTCSTMLLFDSETAVDDWCARHAIPRGDVRPLARIWELSRVWYGRHLDERWRKWTADEARAIFARFELTGPTWDLPRGDGRF